MARTPLLYKSAEFGTTSPTSPPPSYAGRMRSRASPRQPDDAAPAPHEIASLIPGAGTTLQRPDAVAGSRPAAPSSGGGTRSVHLALLAHTLLGFRYCLLPLSALAVGGSVPVAVRLAGQFAIWSLVVLLANLAAGAYVVGQGTNRKATPLRRGLVVTWMALVPLLACATLSRLPMCAPPNAIPWLPVILQCAGPVIVLVFILWFGTCAAVAVCCRESPVSVMYVGWAAGDTLFGVAVGGGLTFGMKMLLQDASSNGAIDADWLWLWRIGIAIQVMAWGAFLAQFAALWLLCRQLGQGAGTRIEPVLTNADNDDEATQGAQNAKAAAKPDKVDAVVAGVGTILSGETKGQMAAATCLVGYVIFLLIGALGWVAGQVAPPGVVCE